MIDTCGKKIILQRKDPDACWETIALAYASRDRWAMRRLAMLALRETAGWPIERIGATFGRSAGHVTRCLETVKKDLRQEFRLEEEVGDRKPEIGGRTSDLRQRPSHRR